MNKNIRSTRPYIFYTGILLVLFSNNVSAQSQCSVDNDQYMRTYWDLAKTDPQGCSQCAQLALYLCGAKHCVEAEDKRKTGSMIAAVRKVIEGMGRPGCCQELLTCTIYWGELANGSSKQGTYLPRNESYLSEGNNSGGIELGNSGNKSGGTGTYSSGDADVDKVMNAATDLVNQINGGTGTSTSYGSTNTYSTGDADVDNVMNAATDLVNQINGGTGTSTSYGSTNTYSTGDADVDNVMNGATDLVNMLGGETGSMGSSVGAVGDLLDLFGSGSNEVSQQDRINQAAEIQRKKEAARLQEQARAQEQIYAQEEKRVYEQKQQLATARKALIAKYPDGKMPLSYPEISEKEIYFFAYRSFEPVPSAPPASGAGSTVPAYKMGNYYLIEGNGAKYYTLLTKKSGGTLLGEYRVVGDPAKKWYKLGGFNDVKILKEVTEQEAKGTNEENTAGGSASSPVKAYKRGHYYLIEASNFKYYVLFTKNLAGTLIGEFRVAKDPTKKWYKEGGFNNPRILKEVTEQEAKGTIEVDIAESIPVVQVASGKAPELASQSGLPEIYISDVISVSKFSDGTWPLKNKVLEKLNLSGDATGIVLSGYYNSQADAVEGQRYLAGKSKEYGFIVKSITGNNYANTKALSPANDNFGKSTSSGSNAVPAKEPVNTKPKLDFWDNPIKD